MHVAAFLSDLKSLSVCSHESALSLVKVYDKIHGDIKDSSAADANHADEKCEPAQYDEDLRRADELVSLHQNVKLRHLDTGPDQEWQQARQAVQEISNRLVGYS